MNVFKLDLWGTLQLNKEVRVVGHNLGKKTTKKKPTTTTNQWRRTVDWCGFSTNLKRKSVQSKHTVGQEVMGSVVAVGFELVTETTASKNMT